MSKPTDLGLDDFTVEVLEAALPVLVDFWSPTCPHCQQFGPQFEAAAVGQGDQVKFVKASAVECRPLFSQYGVSAVPTIVLFSKGAEVTRRQGACNAEELAAWLTEHLQ